ncbi:hypothetical protein D1224_09355 [Henriciella barbarensis]|uniref:Uncharacterized protein n=1 Tax=Henriciella barbarensis TaxID=86342 RepID=A0A399R0G5_9PROT|nr:hypothetical protein D1224_09355 [Henriciella barbarensis]
MGLTALPKAVRAIHLSSQATARLSESSGRPASNERAILRRARPWRTLYSHAERLALPIASTLDAPGPVTSGRNDKRTASGKPRMAILVFAELFPSPSGEGAGVRGGHIEARQTIGSDAPLLITAKSSFC